VLLDSKRDANPFFHLMEGLWMLAGRDDSAFLDNYVRDFGSRFAENGVVHGAYGKRWRTALGFDQLEEIVRRLRKDPTDRQCVLQMWDATLAHAAEDIAFGSEDLIGGQAWKDRPCNTHCYFRVRLEQPQERDAAGGAEPFPVLDMTICCRSNDIVWGAYGANAVHMSMLMEYVAGRVGVGIGTMYQLSNNYHAYVDMLDKIGDPEDLDGSDPYDDGVVHSVAMAENWATWDRDLHKFMVWHDWLWSQTSEYTDVSIGVHNWPENSWFSEVAANVVRAMWHWRRKDYHAAILCAKDIKAPDWSLACREWLFRRMDI
jgi:thymidylate synthase